jgi:hypothetical protein
MYQIDRLTIYSPLIHQKFYDFDKVKYIVGIVNTVRKTVLWTCDGKMDMLSNTLSIISQIIVTLFQIQIIILINIP